MEYLLSFILFAPAVGAAVLTLIPTKNEPFIRWFSLLFAILPLILCIPLYRSFDGTTAAFQFVERWDWIAPFNIEYYLGVDGISIWLVILSCLLCVVAIIASWDIHEKVRGYHILFLLLETGIIGTFVALDLFLFFVFWELTLLPMYFLIGIWGGPQKEYAAIKFFLYTMFGSMLMLIGIISVYFYGGDQIFSIPELMEAQNHVQGYVYLPWFEWSLVPVGLAAFDFQHVLYILFAIGFAVKIPVFPFHTWLPDAHVQAPTPISVILAGILLKMGGYGFYRIAFPFFPEAATNLAWLLALLGVINIIYGSLCAMAQQDMKKLVAYSSIGHMGYMLIGMASFVELGLVGGHFQMFTHGLSSGLLFLLVGVVYHRAHHRNIDGFGGLAQYVPVYAGCMGLATFAGLGLPGFAPFVSESFSFLGGFRSQLPWVSSLAVIGISGILLTAGYMLWMYQRIFFQEPNPEYEDMADINAREFIAALPLMILLIVMFVFPFIYIDLINESILNLHGMIVG